MDNVGGPPGRQHIGGTVREPILDEPDAHLDHEQLDRLTDSLRARAPHATIVVATHDAAWAATVAGRTLHVVDGTVRPYRFLSWP